MVRVLHELASLDGGGVARLLYDYYVHMNRERVQFDFLIYDFFEEGILERPLQELGCRIYKITQPQQDKKACKRQMEKVIREGRYDVVHSHRGPQGAYVLACAKRWGVPRRIIHSHLDYRAPSMERRLKNWLLLRADRLLATDLFACGRAAGTQMWGRRAMERGTVHIMTNAVDTDRFAYSERMRTEKRREMGLNQELTLGIVGRLEEQKNYPFLLKVFAEVLKRQADAVLVIIGRGTKEAQIQRAADQMGISGQIRFLGVRSDVSQLLSALDVFVLPSLYEGLPVVLVEAQANGLPEVVSDRVTDEMAVTDLLRFLPLGDASVWADAILSSTPGEREGYAALVGAGGYGIRAQAAAMERFYLEEN